MTLLVFIVIIASVVNVVMAFRHWQTQREEDVWWQVIHLLIAIALPYFIISIYLQVK